MDETEINKLTIDFIWSIAEMERLGVISKKYSDTMKQKIKVWAYDNKKFLNESKD